MFMFLFTRTCVNYVLLTLGIDWLRCFNYILYIRNLYRIINKRKLDIKRIATDYWTIELKGIHFI